MNFYNEIKDNLIKSEIFDKAKDFAKDRNKVNVYYETGKLLSKAGKEYGKNIIKQYADKLMVEVGKKYNERTLYRMRKLYIIFSNEKLTPLVSKLNWSNLIVLLSLKNINEIKYYIDICEKNKLSKRQLQEKIKSKEYERLSEGVKEKLKEEQQLVIGDLVPNPIIIKSDNGTKLSEYALKQVILNNLDDFLRQLGNGFTYVGNEYKIMLGNRPNYIDMLLFNTEYNCFVVTELKVTELKKEHLGQIQVYMNYIDKYVKSIHHDKTIGIIVVKKDNKYVIEYSSDPRIISREYELV